MSLTGLPRQTKLTYCGQAQVIGCLLPNYALISDVLVLQQVFTWVENIPIPGIEGIKRSAREVITHLV